MLDLEIGQTESHTLRRIMYSLFYRQLLGVALERGGRRHDDDVLIVI